MSLETKVEISHLGEPEAVGHHELYRIREIGEIGLNRIIMG